MNIRVDLNIPINDGTEVVFRSPVDCSQVTGLIVYYPANGNTISKEFAFADAHGNNIGDIDHLFTEDVVVKVILDVTKSMAFVQNADTNAYLEGRFAGIEATIDKLCPVFTENGSVVTCEPVEGYPLGVVSGIDVKQSGSGTPSPDNIRPFAEHTAVNLTRCGKNVFGGDALADKMVSQGAVKNEADGTVQFNPANVDRTPHLFTKFKPNTQYTIILYGTNIDSTATKNGTNLCVRYTDDTVGYFDFTQSIGTNGYCHYTSESGKTILGFRFSYATGETRLYYDKCGIFEGVVTVNDFEAYNDKTFTMDLGQSIYGGSLDWNTGLLTIKYGSIVFDGVTAGKKFTATDATAKIYAYLNTSGNAVSKLGGKSYCNQAEYITIAGSTGDAIVITIGKTYTGVVDEDDRWTVVTKFNALAKSLYDAGTPLIAVYELKTPITVQLTPQEVKALAGVNTIYSDTGDTTVTGKTSPATEIEKLKNAILAMGANV